MAIVGGLQGAIPMVINGPAASSMPLQTQGPPSGTQSLDLNIASDPRNPLTLWLGNSNANENLSLYINPPISTTEAGYTMYSAIQTMAVSGTVNSGHAQSFSLVLTSPSSASGTALIPLQITPTVLDTSSGVLGMVVAADGQNTMPLFIPCQSGITQTAPLYIERDFGAETTLFIKHQMASGIPDLAISGAYMNSGDITLSIHAPFTDTLNFYTDGYLE